MRRKVALLTHAIGSSPIMWDISPVHNWGIKQLFEQRGIITETPLLPGHDASYAELATVSGEQWLESVKQDMRELFADDNTEIYLIGFSLGGLLSLLAVAELLKEGCVPVERTHLLVANAPVHINGVPPWLWNELRKLPRKVLQSIPIPNVPRPWEPNRGYLKQAMVSKLLPLSAVMELMDLVDRLLQQLSNKQLAAKFQELAQLTLIQAHPDRVVHPRSVDTLHNLVGGDIYHIEGATHAFPEEEAWTTLCEIVQNQLTER
jgi:esterase/lipase